jgi:hypothetical protein
MLRATEPKGDFMRSNLRLGGCSGLVFLIAACAAPRATEQVALRQAELDFGAGDIQGTISWKGAPLSPQNAAPLYAAESDVLNFRINTSNYSAHDVAAGAHTLGIYANDCTWDASNKLGETSFTVARGSTTTADVDLTATAGQVTGSITVNGAPLPNANIGLDTPCGGIWADQSGIFSGLLAPRTYSASVYSGSSKLGTFSFTILAGQTTDVDVGTTPVCGNGNPACQPVNLSGGISTVGGISLSFTTVTSAGTTTVVESGAGRPPPTGFRIIGISGQPRYWDINTTATYSGPITVCIHYDETQVQGQESNLKLRHDDGTNWQDVTTSLDTTANIICGVATSLSPFAVFEAINLDADGDKVTDTADRCPGTKPGAVVNASGCSIDDLVPCTGAAGKPWKNHGAYVKAFETTATDFLKQGLIDAATKDRLTSQAGSSKCGK